MKKRVVAVLVALSLLIVTGCAGGGKNSQNDLNFKGYPIETEEKLTYWTTLRPDISSIYNNFGDTEIGKAYEEAVGVDIEWIHPVAGQESTSLSLLIASDELPDIVEYSWGSFQGGAEKSIKEEIILSLNDLIKSDAPNLSKLLADNADLNKATKTDAGDYYVFPSLKEEPILTRTSAMMIRRDWLKELGLEVPKTLNELENVLREFKNKKGAKAPFAMNLYGGGTSGMFAIMGTGEDFYVDNGVVKYSVMDSSYLNACKTWNKWYKEGLLDPDFDSADAASLDANVLNDRTGVVWAGGGGNLGAWLNAKKGTSFDMVGIALPVDEATGKTPGIFGFGNLFDGKGSAISANTKNARLAARVLDYNFSEEGFILSNFGVEGVAYTLVDGQPKYTDLILNNPDGLSVGQTLSIYARATWMGPGMQAKNYLTQFYQLDAQKESLANWEKSFADIDSKTMPFVSLTAEESEEFAAIMAEVNKEVGEARTAFINGSKDLNEYDNFIDDLRALGIERAIEIKQAALDRYNKR